MTKNSNAKYVSSYIHISDCFKSSLQIFITTFHLDLDEKGMKSNTTIYDWIKNFTLQIIWTLFFSLKRLKSHWAKLKPNKGKHRRGTVSRFSVIHCFVTCLTSLYCSFVLPAFTVGFNFEPFLFHCKRSFAITITQYYALLPMIFHRIFSYIINVQN